MCRRAAYPAARDEQDQALSDEQLLAHVNILLVAGHETTTTLGAWVLYLVAAEPGVGERVDAELDGRRRPDASPRRGQWPPEQPARYTLSWIRALLSIFVAFAVSSWPVVWPSRLFSWSARPAAGCRRRRSHLSARRRQRGPIPPVQYPSARCHRQAHHPHQECQRPRRPPPRPRMARSGQRTRSLSRTLEEASPTP